jgi:hypothetical protein
VSVLRALGGTDKDGPLRAVHRLPMLSLKAFIALVVTWCLLAVAAIVAASIRRFEGWYMHLVTAAVLVGLVIVVAIALAP